MVPTVRLTLRTGRSSRTASPDFRAPSLSWIRVLSSAFSSPWSWLVVQCRDAPSGSSGLWKIGRRSSPSVFQWCTAASTSRTSLCPTASSMDRKPSSARYSRTSCAMKRMKLTTYSGRPSNRLRSSGFCVATPTGQVSRWQTRIMMQPDTTSGAVATRDEDDVRPRLRDAGGDRADAELADQLDVDAGPRVRVLEVVDELLDV